MNNNQLSVLRKIIYAVETGGQVYGNACYDDFTEAYTNSSIEHAITIGAGAWYSVEALKLLRNIYAKDSSLFTDSLLYDMDNKNWNNYAISKDSENAKTIVKIISSDVGKKCQDDLLDEQLIAYCNQAEQLGVTDLAAQAMVANWIHQGSISAARRILKKTQKPYTLDNLYEACKSDTGNEVGAYKNRQSFVRNALKLYLDSEDFNEDATISDDTLTPTDPDLAAESSIEQAQEKTVSANDVIRLAEKYLGSDEGGSNHKFIIDTYNAHTPRARGYKVTYTDAWCATFISTLYIMLDATDLIGGTECGCGQMIENMQKAGIWIEDERYANPQPGDIVMFDWDNTNSYIDNTSYPEHVGLVVGAEDGMLYTIEGNTSDSVMRRTYSLDDAHIRGYARPKYTKASNTINTTKDKSDFQILKKGLSGTDVLNMQKKLIKLGYNLGSYGADGDFGNDTKTALKLFQKHHNLEETGIYDIKDKAQLDKSYNNYKSKVFPTEMFTIKDPKSYLREGVSKNKPIVAKPPVGTKVNVTKEKVNSAGNKWLKGSLKINGVKFSGWIVSTSLIY